MDTCLVFSKGFSKGCAWGWGQRLREMLQEMKQHLKRANSGHDDTLRTLKKELVELETATNRLYEAVEKGLQHLNLAQVSAMTVELPKRLRLIDPSW